MALTGHVHRDGQRERESQEGQGELCSLRLKRSEVIGVESGLERL